MRMILMPYLCANISTAFLNSVPLSVDICGTHPKRQTTSCHKNSATSSEDFLDSIRASSHPVKSSLMSTMYRYLPDLMPISTKSRLNFLNTVGTHVGFIMTSIGIVGMCGNTVRFASAY